MIYLDNSSTTHKKPLKVMYACWKGVSTLSVNPSRAGYKLAIKGTEVMYSTREKLSQYLGTNPEDIIFTSGCTMALNLAIMGTAQKNGHIIATIYEHNSVMRVLERLKITHNISYTLIEPNKSGLISTSDISKAITPDTYMVITNHTSNVTGATQNIASIGKLCKKMKLIYLVDGAQSVGHEEIDMKKLNINLLTIAGHKGLYAPQGIGALAINNVTVNPLIFGGTGTHSNKITQPVDIPDGLESGTPNIVGILGLKAGVEFVEKNQDKINNKIEKLSSELLYNLHRIKNVKVYSSNSHSGVISFNIKGKDSIEVSNTLDDKYNIAVRGGLHCAPLVHKFYGTLKSGMCRISISYYNSRSDIKKIIKAIEEIALN